MHRPIAANRSIATMWTLALLSACGKEEEGSGDTASAVIDCSREPALDWDNYAAGFFDKNCNGCHSSELTGEARYGAPPGVDFDTEDGALALAERVHERVVVQETMPPGGGLLPSEMRMIDEWLQCAADTP